MVLTFLLPSMSAIYMVHFSAHMDVGISQEFMYKSWTNINHEQTQGKLKKQKIINSILLFNVNFFGLDCIMPDYSQDSKK